MIILRPKTRTCPMKKTFTLFALVMTLNTPMAKACGPLTPVCAYTAWQWLVGGLVVSAGGAAIVASQNNGNSLPGFFNGPDEFYFEASSEQVSVEGEDTSDVYYLVLEVNDTVYSQLDIPELDQILKNQGFNGNFQYQDDKYNIYPEEKGKPKKKIISSVYGPYDEKTCFQIREEKCEPYEGIIGVEYKNKTPINGNEHDIKYYCECMPASP